MKWQRQENFENIPYFIETLKNLNFEVRQCSPFHLKINDEIDFWPTTELYIDNITFERNYGFENLINHLGKTFRCEDFAEVGE